MPLLELKSVAKSFGGSPALRGVSAEIAPGEHVGLIGENGAGKSTLIKLLAGVHQPDSGEVSWDGRPVRFQHPRAAMQAGIATIHQELTYFEKLTVAENMMLGEKWPRRFRLTDWRKLNEEAARRLRAAGLDLNPRGLFQELSPAERQEVAIARALSQNAKLLILDEPTASLTEPEVKRLFGHLARLRTSGVAVLYVSHRLDEIQTVTERVIVLRDGALVANHRTAAVTIGQMVRDMVGRELQAVTAATKDRTHGEPLLEVAGLGDGHRFHDVSFTLHRGEILGIGGLVGAGRSDLARVIYGLIPAAQGAMKLDGADFAPKHPADARARGIVYLPEERKRHGFVLDHSVRSGISISLVPKLSLAGLVSGKTERRKVSAAIEKYGIRLNNMEQPIGGLSGGNQQKALLARWLETDPTLVVLDEPTRGVDVGAKAEIHRRIRELSSRGKGVILISSDLPELLALSDRLIVLHRGKVSARLETNEASQEAVILAASGYPAA